MIQEFLDKKVVRNIIGGLIGIPVTLISLFLGFHSLILGYGGLVKGKPLWFLVGVSSALGIIGLGGAWIRLSASSLHMPTKLLQHTRVMLYCGLLSSLMLSAMSVLYAYMEALLVTVPLLVIGIFFLIATPASSNKSLKTGTPQSGAP